VRITRQTADELRAVAATMREKDERLTELLAGKMAPEAELAHLREEVAQAKKAAAAQADTRLQRGGDPDFFIDLLLKEAGWQLADARDREFEVAGMPNGDGRGS